MNNRFRVFVESMVYCLCFSIVWIAIAPLTEGMAAEACAAPVCVKGMKVKMTDVEVSDAFKANTYAVKVFAVDVNKTGIVQQQNSYMN